MEDLHTTRNMLLAGVSRGARERLSSHLTSVALGLGQVLHRPDRHERYVYFPLTAIVSSLYTLKNGASAELALIGYEGLASVASFLNGGATPTTSIVQGAGMALRGTASVLKEEFADRKSVV